MENTNYPQIKEVIRLKGIRKTIAQRMRASLNTAAQAMHVIEIDLSRVMDLHKELKDEGKKISITDILIKATALSLRETPLLNSTIEENEISVYEDINIALAIAIENGLVTPVIRCADKKSLAQISEAVKDMTFRAKAGQLTLDDFTGGTFTVSNLGMYGIDQFTAIINPPQSGILAISAAKKRVVVTEGDQMEIKPVMKVTLTYDHRVLDGAPAAQFLGRLKDICENRINKE